MTDSVGAPWFRPALRCPDCREPLSGDDLEVACPPCERSIDLRARPIELKPRLGRSHRFVVPARFDPESLLAAASFEAPRAVAGAPRGGRDSRELFAALFEQGLRGGDLLDLGCGPRDQIQPAHFHGFRYVGVDVDHSAADIRADGHALPFAAESFDAVLSFAVIEHLHHPLVAMQEIHRVLRPDGMLVATVSQGEPFHGSYFHHTPWAIAALAASVGMPIRRLWSSRDTLSAMSDMGQYSRPVRVALRALAGFDRWTPFLRPRSWLAADPRTTARSRLEKSGSLCFLLQKPPADLGSQIGASESAAP